MTYELEIDEDFDYHGDFEDVSEDEESLSHMVTDRRFGLEPYVFDPSASSSSEADGDTAGTPTPRPGTPPPSLRVGTADWYAFYSISSQTLNLTFVKNGKSSRSARAPCTDNASRALTRRDAFNVGVLAARADRELLLFRSPFHTLVISG